MANADEPENLSGRRVFINCVDSYQGKNIAKVTYTIIVINVSVVTTQPADLSKLLVVVLVN